MTPRLLHIDFEFNSGEVICGAAQETLGGQHVAAHRWDLRGGRDLRRMLGVVHQPDTVLTTYSAEAEMTSLMRLGVDVGPLKVVDLFVETTMVTFSHPAYEAKGKDPKIPGLLEACRRFGVPVVTETDHKADMRDLILSRTAWSDEEFTAIQAYCEEDTRPLPDLLRAIQKIHLTVGTGWRLAQAIERAEHVKACALLKWRSMGFPVDTEWLDFAYSNRTEIADRLCAAANDHYGTTLFRSKRGGGHSFYMQGFTDLVVKIGLSEVWKHTASGRTATDADYVEQMAELVPDLAVFRRAHQTHKAVAMKHDPRRDVVNGSTHPWAFPYGSVTGRNQPRPNAGFLLLGSSPWLRAAIRPPPGFTIIERDWSKQEIAVAAQASGDQALRAAYASYDFYLTVARSLGLIPPGTEINAENKRIYKEQRETAKTFALGVSYGMGISGVAGRLIAASRGALSEPQAVAQARTFFALHRQEFEGYWTWGDRTIADSKASGYLRAVDASCDCDDGWLRFVGQDARETALRNFRMQAGGSLMMRRATKLITTTGLDLMCSLHDSFFIIAPEQEADEHEQVLADCMQRAADDVCPSVRIGGEVKTRLVAGEPMLKNDEASRAVVGAVNAMIAERRLAA